MIRYARIASNLGRFERLSSEFLTNPEFQQNLAVYYADILQFHKHAYTFVRRSGETFAWTTSPVWLDKTNQLQVGDFFS